MGHLQVARPNKILTMDFTVLDPSRSGLENVLVMIDIFTKYTLAIPTRGQGAKTVTQVLVVEWFCKFGVPGHIHSDQGRILLKNTTPYDPAGNCQCEQNLAQPVGHVERAKERRLATLSIG